MVMKYITEKQAEKIASAGVLRVCMRYVRTWENLFDPQRTPGSAYIPKGRASEPRYYAAIDYDMDVDTTIYYLREEVVKLTAEDAEARLR